MGGKFRSEKMSRKTSNCVFISLWLFLGGLVFPFGIGFAQQLEGPVVQIYYSGAQSGYLEPCG